MFLRTWVDGFNCTTIDYSTLQFFFRCRCRCRMQHRAAKEETPLHIYAWEPDGNRDGVINASKQGCLVPSCQEGKLPNSHIQESPGSASCGTVSTRTWMEDQRRWHFHPLDGSSTCSYQCYGICPLFVQKKIAIYRLMQMQQLWEYAKWRAVYSTRKWWFRCWRVPLTPYSLLHKSCNCWHELNFTLHQSWKISSACYFEVYPLSQSFKIILY